MNRTSACLRAGRLIIASIAVAFAWPALPQGLPIPPRHDSTSPTGVSFATGTFTYSVRDLSIGGEFPAGLTLDRTYISNLSYSNLGGHGWTHNWSGSINSRIVTPPMGTSWTEHQEPWVFDVSVGGRSVGFRGGSGYPPTTGGPVGPYWPIEASGASLVFTGTTGGNGRYVFTDSDGTVIDFTLGGPSPSGLQDWTAPDGTRLEFGYDPVTVRLRSIISNRGYALLFEPATPPGQWKVCAVNLTQHVITPTSPCPAGVQSVTYTYVMGTYNPYMPLLATATDATGQTTNYTYVNPDRLGCIRPPGQATCQIQNSYTLCYDYYWEEPNPVRYAGEYVTSQQDAANATYSYNYAFTFDQYDANDPDRPRCRGSYSFNTTLTTNGTAATWVSSNSANLPTVIVDPLNRGTNIWYNNSNPMWIENLETQLAQVMQPLGNSVEYFYDDRGNMIRQLVHAVPGSGLPDIETTAVYPSTCVHRKTCNRPTSVTDARGATTDYTYDPAHGGVLTETGPLVSTTQASGTIVNVRPQTRHAYAQRYAWILASGGSYVQAATPVWVRTSTSLCRTSAATGNPASPCAVAGDEVLTQYDYGPNSGPNNLLLRGQVVTADGQSLRTCYGYDRQGNRISETQPNANLGACP